MPRVRHTAEQIIGKLRQAEGEVVKSGSIAAVCKAIGVTEQNYYRWRKEYGGLEVDQPHRRTQPVSAAPKPDRLPRTLEGLVLTTSVAGHARDHRHDLPRQ